MHMAMFLHSLLAGQFVFQGPLAGGVYLQVLQNELTQLLQEINFWMDDCICAYNTAERLSILVVQ
jgi:hypothetical protein